MGVKLKIRFYSGAVNFPDNFNELTLCEQSAHKKTITKCNSNLDMRNL